MKNVSIACSLIVLALSFSCSKSSESPTFKKADFVGVWEENGTSDGKCTDIVKFDATTMYDGTKCGTTQDFDSGITYTYDNKNTITITESGITIKYVILSLNATTLKVEASALGQKATVTYTKL